MWSPCQECVNCSVPKCNSCSKCKNKKRCCKRGKCLKPKWVGKSPEPPSSSSPSVLPPSSTPQASGGHLPVSSPASSSAAPPLSLSSMVDASGDSLVQSGSVSLPTLSSLYPSLAKRLSSLVNNASSPSVHSLATSSPSPAIRSGRPKVKGGAKRSLPSPEESAPPKTRKKTLQDQHEKMLVVEKDCVELFKDKGGLNGVKYKFRKCGRVERYRIDCIRLLQSVARRREGKFLNVGKTCKSFLVICAIIKRPQGSS